MNLLFAPPYCPRKLSSTQYYSRMSMKAGEAFGAKLNFLYRIFMIFIIGSIAMVFLSKYFKRKTGLVKAHDLSVSFSGTRNTVLRFAAIHLPFILLILTGMVTPQVAAFPAAFFTFILFIWYLKKNDQGVRFYQSDIFYAGILSATMVWIMYYFA